MTNTVYKATNIFDVDWETVDDSVGKKPEKYLKFSFPPLEYVCARIRNGTELSSIGDELKLGGDTNVPLLAQDTDLSNKIYSHFKNKHTMRRLRGEYISKYMLAVDNVCENKYEILDENLPVLLTLPRFYEQNLRIEGIMKHGISIDKRKSYNLPFEKDLEFLDCVNISNKSHNSNHYFWKTKEGTLVRAVVKAYDISNSVWRCLAKQKHIRIKSDFTNISNIQGYDYYVYNLFHDAEIEIL